MILQPCTVVRTKVEARHNWRRGRSLHAVHSRLRCGQQVHGGRAERLILLQLLAWQQARCAACWAGRLCGRLHCWRASLRLAHTVLALKCGVSTCSVKQASFQPCLSTYTLLRSSRLTCGLAGAAWLCGCITSADDITRKQQVRHSLHAQCQAGPQSPLAGRLICLRACSTEPLTIERFSIKPSKWGVCPQCASTALSYLKQHCSS